MGDSLDTQAAILRLPMAFLRSFCTYREKAVSLHGDEDANGQR